MTKQFDELTEAERWRLMVLTAKKGAAESGLALEKMPGRGLSNVYWAAKGGKRVSVAIRTTRDRWIAFPPLEGGTKWKTLSDVDLVVVASLDSKEAPKNVEVYVFPADEVRKRFDQAYKARKAAGHTMKDNFGMWVSLDLDKRDVPAAVGSGIVEKFKRVASYPIAALLAEREEAEPTPEVSEKTSPTGSESVQPPMTTISKVMDWARQRVAEIADVDVEAVKLDLKIQY